MVGATSSESFSTIVHANVWCAPIIVPLCMTRGGSTEEGGDRPLPKGLLAKKSRRQADQK